MKDTVPLKIIGLQEIKIIELQEIKIIGLQQLQNSSEHCSMYATYYKTENEINRYKYYCINLDNFTKGAQLDPLEFECVFRFP
jgi:hypothetical protein